MLLKFSRFFSLRTTSNWCEKSSEGFLLFCQYAARELNLFELLTDVAAFKKWIDKKSYLVIAQNQHISTQGNIRVLPKSTLWTLGWFDTSEVSHKKAHWLVEVEMSSHLFFYMLKWAFLWLTSAVPNQKEFMQRVDLGKTLFLALVSTK